ncbi:hypothetical protein N0M98_11800 [Paenibacillus doosanensis]|uniref:hypothetical protein n=1 Tax=Paenibacillus doosanensis TaxID=1229154 RepID=UPI002180852F|nr:hypothetical protein [Paenibacillus doosanensis]MCS7460828.1 hypothetical protein [Paenibacillus doosanensis]
MGFIKFIGWLVVPYIMLFIRWKNMGNIGKIFSIPWAIISLIVLLSAMSSGGENSPDTVTTTATVNQKEDVKADNTAQESAAKADKEAKAKADAEAKKKAEEEKAKNPQWNTKEIYADKNGNVDLAVKLLKAVEDISTNLEKETASPATVMKTPWNYYGKAMSFSGEIGFVQDYPPGSNFEKMGILSQIVIGAEDGTPVDLLLTIPSGSLKVGDKISILAVPVGIFDNDNKLGGKTQVLAAVANKLI